MTVTEKRSEEADTGDRRRNDEPAVAGVVFRCNECTVDVVFNSRDELREHRRQFHKGKGIEGTSRNAQEKASVEDEDALATDGDEQKDDIATEKRSEEADTGDRRRNEEPAVAGVVFRCNECTVDVVFNSRDELGEHRRQFHKGKAIAGTSRNAQEKAPVEDEDEDDIATDGDEQEAVGGGDWRCSECTGEAAFNSRGDLYEHRRQFHGNSRNSDMSGDRDDTEDEKEEIRGDEIVGEERDAYDDAGGARRTRRKPPRLSEEMAAAAIRHRCPHCRDGFSTSNGLRQHVRRRHGPIRNDRVRARNPPVRLADEVSVEATRHRCEQCGKTFSSNNNLARHMRLHTELAMAVESEEEDDVEEEVEAPNDAIFNPTKRQRSDRQVILAAKTLTRMR